MLAERGLGADGPFSGMNENSSILNAVEDHQTYGKERFITPKLLNQK